MSTRPVVSFCNIYKYQLIVFKETNMFCVNYTSKREAEEEKKKKWRRRGGREEEEEGEEKK